MKHKFNKKILLSCLDRPKRIFEGYFGWKNREGKFLEKFQKPLKSYSNFPSDFLLKFPSNLEINFKWLTTLRDSIIYYHAPPPTTKTSNQKKTPSEIPKHIKTKSFKCEILSTAMRLNYLEINLKRVEIKMLLNFLSDSSLY